MEGEGKGRKEQEKKRTEGKKAYVNKKGKQGKGEEENGMTRNKTDQRLHRQLSVSLRYIVRPFL